MTQAQQDGALVEDRLLVVTQQRDALADAIFRNRPAQINVTHLVTRLRDERAYHQSRIDQLLAALKGVTRLIETHAAVQREGITGGACSVLMASVGSEWVDEFNAAEAAITKEEGR
jgi:hypothetical protein